MSTYPVASNEHYYVSLEVRGRLVLLVGPFTSHGEAGGHVDAARRIMLSVEHRFDRETTVRLPWATYGVVLVRSDDPPSGKLEQWGMWPDGGSGDDR